MRNAISSVLIADDDAKHRRFLRGLLRGSEIDEVANANDLINRAREGEYHLIITDYDMQEQRGSHGEILFPDQTGLYAIEKIREFDEGTPIIMNSSYGGFDLVVDALNKGADEFISKRSSVDEFSQVIWKYLNKSEGDNK